MERTLTVIFGAVVAALVVLFAFLLVFNPMRSRSAALAAEREHITPVEARFDKPNWPFEKWQQSAASRPGLWQELLTPPKPPAPPPEPPPDINALAKGITASRQQIGGKVKIMQPGETKGAFMGVGDTVHGLTVKEITKTSVVLSLTWKGQELTTDLERK